jgi:uncharacterized membrane protein YkoI
MMRQRKSILAVLALVTCGGLTVSLWAASIALDKVPAKAGEALQKLAGTNKIVEVGTEKEHGIQVYEAEWVVDGTEVEAEVTAEGVLLEMEEAVKVKAVPPAVRAAAEKALAGAPTLQYEKHTVTFYEVEGKDNGKKKEVSISAAGKLMEQEEEGDADDDNDDRGK